MADGKFSLDDILDEYPKSGSGTTNLDLDDILNDIAPKTAEKPNEAENIHTEKAPDMTEQKPHQTASAAPAGSDFKQKYGSLEGKLGQISEAAAEKAKDYKPEPVQKRDRSFSEKLEEPDYSNDRKSAERLEKAAKREKIKRALSEDLFEKAGLTSYNESEESVPPRIFTEDDGKEKPNPYAKFDAIANGENDEGDTRSVDDILAEYDSYNVVKAQKIRSGNTVHKNFTDIFARLIPKEGDNEVSELTGAMKKMRQSRTSQIPPMERKTISDIDLNLDGKIIRDTAPLPNFKEQTEAEKLNELNSRRSKKVKDFVLVGDEEELDESEINGGDAQKEIDDFGDFDDAPSISADIMQLNRTLAIRLLVLIICFLFSLYITIANDTGILPIADVFNKRTQTNAFLFTNAIVGIFAAFSSYAVISCGLSKLFSLKADGDSLCAVSTVTSIAVSMIMFANTNLVKGDIVHVYVPVAIAALIFNTVGKLLIVSRTKRSFRFISGSGEKYALFQLEEEKAQDFTRGALHDFPVLTSMRKTELITDFLKTTYAPDITDKFSSLFTPIVIAAGIIVAVLAGLTSNAEYGTSGVYVGISSFVGCMAMCSAFSMMLVVNLPMERSSKKNNELQGQLLGFGAVDKYAFTNSILIDASQLFPQGSVNLSAIKVFSDMRIDEAIVEAASLTNQSGSILKNMFYDIIAGKTEMLNPVESYIFEDSMGICGWINNKRVLLGNRELMINHSIEATPTVAKEKEYTSNGRAAVYLSISGELSAMFIVDITPSMEVKQALAELQKREIYTVIRSVDSLVTINRLSELFGVSPEFFKLVPFRVHKDFDEITGYQPKQSAMLACSGKFAAFSSLVLSCKSLRGTITIGLGIQAISILLGILICLAMVILRSFGELTSTMAIIYNLIFTAFLLIFQTFRRN